MIAPYFRTPERRTALLKEAESWIGTPFAARSMAKGAGVDCVHLGAALYIATGVLKDFKPPRYTLDGARYLDHSIVERFLTETGQFQERDFLSYAPQPGDVLTFNVGRISHHIGTMIDGSRFIHVIQRRETMFSNVRDGAWSVRINKVFVPIEEVQ